MIVELFVDVLAGLIGFLAGLFGTLQIPSWWVDAKGWIASLADFSAGFGQWLPMGTVVSALTFLAACVGLAFIIKVVRVVASFFTAGGGSAA